MKKTFLLPLLLWCALPALADGTYKKRNNCFGFLSWRYKVTATATKITGDSRYTGGTSSSGTCNSLASCTAAGTFKEWGSETPQVVATVTSKIGPGVSGQVSTWVHWMHQGKFYLGGNPLNSYNGYPSNALYTPAAFDSTSPVPTGYGATASTRDIVFDERSHSIIIQGINGNLGVDVPDAANAFSTIKIWVLDARNVTNEDNARVITTMQAFVLNGQLVLQGGFSQQDFEQTERGKAQYTITNVTKTVAIDKNISLDDIIVKVGSDAGTLDQGVAAAYKIDFSTPEVKKITAQMEEEALFKLNVLQNPVNGTLNISLANGQKNYQSVSLSVVSATGETVKQVYSGKLGEKTTQYFSADVAAIKPGVYFLVAVTGNGDKYSRKFIKTE